jgi:hypothetical protein
MALCCPSAGAQNGLPNSSTASSPVNLSGVVVSANGGTPISRALVQMNGRSILTDHEGKFEFDQMGPVSSVSVQVKKPGYYFGRGDGSGSVVLRGTQLSSSIVLKLYPEALITGTLSGPDGAPLRQIVVMAVKNSYSDSGSQWFPVGQSTTNSRGEFRLAVPAGDYRIETNYSPRGADSRIVLPLNYPSPGAADTESSIHMANGTEQRLDLHPIVDRSYTVALRMDTQERGFPMIFARAADGSGFPVTILRGGAQGGGEIPIALPSGTFTLIASRNMGDQSEYGEASVTVGDRDDLTGVTLRMSSVASIPLEIAVDGTSDKAPPTPQQLGLMLTNTQSGSFRFGAMTALVMPMGGGSGRDAYLRPMPGTYRLRARSSGQWYIKSASYGSVDLLRQTMTVAPASGSSPILVTVSDDTGGLQGTVHAAEAAWVVAVPTSSSAVPVYTTRTAADGSFSLTSLPPGGYQVLAFESRQQSDLSDPKVLAAFTTSARTVNVTAGNKTNVDLDVIQDDEVHP